MKSYIVDSSALRENIQYLKNQAGETAIYGVIKGNGYGLGLLPMAELLWDSGIRRFAVTEPEDVLALRETGMVDAEVLMLRETDLETELRVLIAANAVLTVGSIATAQLISRLSGEMGRHSQCHIKIDTGMGRYGFLPDQISDIVEIYHMSSLSVAGIYTHFYNAFSDTDDTRNQFNTFKQVLSALAQKGISTGICHCCNSSAFLKYPEMHMDAVRLGSAILGRLSFSGVSALKPVGWCEAEVEIIRTIPKGHSVGYGAGWRAKRPTRIAVFSVGYYHGFSARPRNDLTRFRDCISSILSGIRSYKRPICVTINQKKAPVLGHIGMVQTVCDVTDIECDIGDMVHIDINPLRFKALQLVYR